MPRKRTCPVCLVHLLFLLYGDELLRGRVEQEDPVSKLVIRFSSALEDLANALGRVHLQEERREVALLSFSALVFWCWTSLLLLGRKNRVLEGGTSAGRTERSKGKSQGLKPPSGLLKIFFPVRFIDDTSKYINYSFLSLEDLVFTFISIRERNATCGR